MCISKFTSIYGSVLTCPATVCGSDVHQYFEIMPIISPTPTEPHHVTKETLPVVMGHECVSACCLGSTAVHDIFALTKAGRIRFSGTIVELGPEVDKTRFAVGQRVTM